MPDINMEQSYDVVGQGEGEYPKATKIVAIVADPIALSALIAPIMIDAGTTVGQNVTAFTNSVRKKRWCK